MIRTSQIAATITALAITLSVTLYAYGYYMTTLEELFTYSAAGLVTKTLLGIAMLILMFFARPRSKFLRYTLGTIASIVLAYTVFGALSQTLALGEAVVMLIGTLAAMNEAVEGELPQPTTNRARRIPVVEA